MAAERQTLEGQIPQKELRRFSAYLADVAGNAIFKLRFRKQRNGKIQIQGNAGTRVTMLCQYCLEPVELDVNVEISQIVMSSQEERIEQGIQEDILVVEGDRVELSMIIEDDLILGLPMVAKHVGRDGTSSCLDRLQYEPLDENQPVKPSPFAVLKKLKLDKSSD